jgi:hypothetical protein
MAAANPEKPVPTITTSASSSHLRDASKVGSVEGIRERDGEGKVDLERLTKLLLEEVPADEGTAQR